MRKIKYPAPIYAVLLIGVFASSSASIFIRLAQSEGVPSFVLAAGRVALATLILTPLVARNSDYVAQIRQLKRQDYLLTGIAGFFLGLHFASWISSLEYTTVLVSIVLVSTAPIWVALLEVFWLKTRLSQAVIIGLLLAVCGGMLIGLAGDDADTVPNAKPLLGAALATAGAVAVAIYMIIGRKIRPHLALTPYIWLVYGGATITLLGIVLFTGTPITGYSAEGYLYIVALALIPQLTGHSSVNYLLAHLPATYVSLAWQMESILSTLGALIIFGEVPRPIQILGGLVITIGVALATVNNRELVMKFLKKPRLRETIWLSALFLYILGGIKDTPFHGDEATTIWMSRDYAYVFLQQDFNRVRYNEPSVNAAEQHMRLITGSLTKYLMGVAWHNNGYTADEINEQWDWGADWNYNQNTGHAPNSELLLLGRWPPTLMLAAGVVVIFAIGKQVGKQPVAYLTSFYYALNPALLLNGRRAMFEGGLILFSLLVVWAAIRLLNRPSWKSTIWLGVVSGLAISAKHPAMFTLLAVFGAGGISALAQGSRRRADRWIIRRYIPDTTSTGLRLLRQLIVAGMLALVIFYALNPVWWGDNPITRAEQVYQARKDILDGQVAAFGGYDSPVDRVMGFGRQVFIGHPQYYEARDWAEYIGDQIDHYAASPWRGIGFGEFAPGAIALLLLSIIGWWRLWRERMTAARRIVGVWTIVILLTSLALTPLEWQRYYLMAYPVIGLLASVGVVWLLQFTPVFEHDERERGKD